MDAMFGHCRCGRVTIRTGGQPVLTMACHCRGCQRMTASAFSLSSLFPDETVAISGETILGGLHGEFRHHHCAHCLGWVFTRADIMGPMVNIRSTMLDGGAVEPPFMETWTDARLPWVTTGAARRYPQFPPFEDFPRAMADFAARNA